MTISENSIYGDRAIDVEIALRRGYEWFLAGNARRFIAPKGWFYDDGSSGVSESYTLARGDEPLAPAWAYHLPFVSTDNDSAMELFAEMPHGLLGNSVWTGGNQWFCSFGAGDDSKGYYAATAAMAICLAWLAWKKGE